MNENSGHKEVEVPTDVDWSQRAKPVSVVMASLGMNAVTTRHGRQQIGLVAAQNHAYMSSKLTDQSGEIYGIHGTSAVAAELIKQTGFLNMVNEEGRVGVSIWDSVVDPSEALKFASDRARLHGDGPGSLGAVIRVRAIDPVPDERGRLEWRADANRVEILEVIPTDVYLARLGGTAATGSGLISPDISPLR